MGNLLNLGCNNCSPCGFNCTPNIDSVSATICGATVVWPWDASGSIEASNTTDCLKQFMQCTHNLSSCESPVFYTYQDSTGGSGTSFCQTAGVERYKVSFTWWYRVYKARSRHLNIRLLANGDIELTVTISYHFRVAIYYEYDYDYFTWNGSAWVLAGTVTGFTGEIFLDVISPKCNQNRILNCVDCSSSEVKVLQCENYSVYRQTFTLADCANFWNTFTLPKLLDETNDCVVSQNGTGVNSCLIALTFISTSAGTICQAIITPNLTISGVSCSDTEAYVDFTEV